MTVFWATTSHGERAGFTSRRLLFCVIVAAVVALLWWAEKLDGGDTNTLNRLDDFLVEGREVSL